MLVPWGMMDGSSQFMLPQQRHLGGYNNPSVTGNQFPNTRYISYQPLNRHYHQNLQQKENWNHNKGGWSLFGYCSDQLSAMKEYENNFVQGLWSVGEQLAAINKRAAANSSCFSKLPASWRTHYTNDVQPKIQQILNSLREAYQSAAQNRTKDPLFPSFNGGEGGERGVTGVTVIPSVQKNAGSHQRKTTTKTTTISTANRRRMVSVGRQRKPSAFISKKTAGTQNIKTKKTKLTTPKKKNVKAKSATTAGGAASKKPAAARTKNAAKKKKNHVN